MSGIQLNRWIERGRRVLRVLGTLDGDAANELLIEIRREPELDIVVDVASVRGFDEVGVAALARLVEGSDGRIALRGLSLHQLKHPALPGRGALGREPRVTRGRARSPNRSGGNVMPSPIVMVVDDEPDVREAITEVLSGEGFEVQTARNGREALDELRSGGPLPDVIVLDVTMPVMDGITFRLTQLRDPELRAIPVIIASALVPIGELAETRQIQKPFRIGEIVDALSQALEGGRREAQLAM